MLKSWGLRLLALTLAGAFLLFGLTGCGSEEPAEGDYFYPGTYTGSAEGYSGKIKVEVEVDEMSILAVRITDEEEEDPLEALEAIPQAVVDSQTLAVDAVSGSTVTSDAVIEAAAQALEKAGADLELWRSGETALAPDEELEADVVIAGGGAAGLSAAIEAARAGADVLLVETTDTLGGNALDSRGILMAGGTSVQQAAGSLDTAGYFGMYLVDAGEGGVNEAKLEQIAQMSPENIDWLAEMGVQFDPQVLAVGYTAAARGHQVQGGGMALAQALMDKAGQEGVIVRTLTTAREILMENGRAAGLVCTGPEGQTITIKAGAVILATGGYDRNEELTEQYAPFSYGTSRTRPASVGDGLVMAREAGALIVAGGGGMVLFEDPAAGLAEPMGLYVDTAGERFINEDAFPYRISQALLERQQVMMFYITDSQGYQDGFQTGLEQGTVFQADTLEELAAQLRMDGAALSATVARYNELCQAGADSDFGKSAQYLTPVSQGPFYAVVFLPVTEGSFGGPLTDGSGQVLDKDGQLIEGLYAAGELANGDLFYQLYPGDGASLQACIATGRAAGQSAAASLG